MAQLYVRIYASLARRQTVVDRVIVSIDAELLDWLHFSSSALARRWGTTTALDHAKRCCDVGSHMRNVNKFRISKYNFLNVMKDYCLSKRIGPACNIFVFFYRVTLCCLASCATALYSSVRLSQTERVFYQNSKICRNAINDVNINLKPEFLVCESC